MKRDSLQKEIREGSKRELILLYIIVVGAVLLTISVAINITNFPFVKYDCTYYRFQKASNPKFVIPVNQSTDRNGDGTACE